ncbi:hypothetical protein BDR26DRAFT_869345 [Obelidium mucronatum]|nr:hypothetical protein BDR26DRAFT_869345 [Obelidium mucronatum]
MPPEIDVKRFTNGSLPDRDAYDYKSDSVYNSMQRPESSAEGSYFSFAIGPDELQVRPTSSPSADRNVLSVIPMILNPAPFQSDSPSPYPESYMRETPLPNSPTPPSLPSRPVLVPFLSTSSTSSSISSSIHQRDSWRHSFSSNISSILAGPNTASATQDSFSHADGKTSPPATPPNYQYFQQPPPPQTYNNVNAREVGPSSVSYFSGRGNSAVITESLVGGFGGVSPRRTSLVFAMDEELRSRTLGRDSLASANGGVGGVDLLLAEEDEDEEDNYEPSLVEAVIAGGSEC